MHARVEGNTVTAEPISLLGLFWLFLKIGATAWGGFMALISVIQNMVVERRRLLTHEAMLDGISLATLLPGPIAVNVVAYAGYRLRGGLGAAVSMFAVILPSFLMVLGLSMAYHHWGQIPAVDKLFMGFIPAITAIIVNAAWGMRKKALPDWPEWSIALVAALLMILVGGFYLTLGIILGAGLLGWVTFRSAFETEKAVVTPLASGRGGHFKWLLAGVLMAVALVSFLVPVPGIEAYPAAHLGSVFGGMSLLLFGGGFVFIPLIQEVVVEGLQWVSHGEFTTAIAVGQVTPGPILISATFIGYKVYGVVGAFVATAAIFTPPALLMLMASQALERIRHSVGIQAALRGVRAAVVGLIFAAALVIAQTAEVHWASAAIFLGALLAMMKLKLDVIWIIPSAGLLGLLLY